MSHSTGRSPRSRTPLAGASSSAWVGGSASISELAEPLDISLTGMKKHVRVLEDAGLVATEKVGRTRRCELGPRRLDELQEWMDAYRRMLDERLDRFGELLQRTEGESDDQ
ncbi:MAG: helix-turn-helix domain-containing protein [Thermoleophilaceae bacterium]